MDRGWPIADHSTADRSIDGGAGKARGWIIPNPNDPFAVEQLSSHPEARPRRRGGVRRWPQGRGI